MATYTKNLNLKKPADSENFDIADFNNNSDTLDEEISKRLIRNDSIPAQTKPKISYDTNGLVVGGEELSPEDIPNLHISKIEGRAPVVYVNDIPIYGSRFFDTDEANNIVLCEDGSGEYLLTVLENGEVLLRKIVTQLDDSLESDNEKAALSARQGKTLKGLINAVSESLSSITGSIIDNVSEIASKLTAHIGNKNNPHGVTKSQMELGNVDNTADSAKKVLSATKLTTSRKINGVSFDGSKDITIADSTKIPTTQKGAAGGVAELDAGGKVPASQLPSYVDDVIEGYYYNGKFYKEAAHTTEITGETGKIYVSLDSNLTYRWSGTKYVEISQSLALGETSSTAYAGNKGKKNAEDISTLSEKMTTAESDIDTLQSEKAQKTYVDEKLADKADLDNGIIAHSQLPFDVVSVDDTVLYPTAFVDVEDNGDIYLREDGSGDYLLYVTVMGIPMLRYMGNKITDDVTGVSYSFVVSNGAAVLKQL